MKLWLKSASSWNSTHQVHHTTKVFGKDKWWEVSRKFFFCANFGNTRLTDEILTTTFCIVEQILNAHTLFRSSADAIDLDILTLNHFLPGTTGSILPSNLSSDFDHKKRCASAQVYSDAIWSRWFRKYVPNLNRRSKWSSLADRDLKTGNVVWIVEATIPRKYYSLARIVVLNYGSDAIARSAEVRKMSGNLIRPIVKLAPVLPPRSLVEFFHWPFAAVTQKLFIWLIWSCKWCWKSD